MDHLHWAFSTNLQLALWASALMLFTAGFALLYAQGANAVKMGKELRMLEMRSIQIELEIAKHRRARAMLERRLVGLDLAVEDLVREHCELRARWVSSRSFEHANRLARSGSDSESLVELCGLSRGEAQLVMNLQRPAPGEALEEDAELIKHLP